MKDYTAIYSTEAIKNIQYYFHAADGNMAKEFCHYKFSAKDITIRDEETGEEFPMVDEWLSDSAYVSRCMVSGRYHLYIRDTWGGKEMSFAPVVEVTKDIVPETVVNEYNESKAVKTTHKVGNWYVGLPSEHLKAACENHGKITFEAI